MRSFIPVLFTQNITTMIKLRMMRWKRHAAHMRAKRNAYKILVEKKERDN
jgi:hypothetical protein